MKKVERIVKLLDEIQNECEGLGETYGEKAMEIISDYPLYVSGTSNISYGTAIAIALMFGGIEEQEQQEKLMDEYFKTLKKGEKATIDGYNKWLSENS